MLTLNDFKEGCEFRLSTTFTQSYAASVGIRASHVLGGSCGGMFELDVEMLAGKMEARDARLAQRLEVFKQQTVEFAIQHKTPPILQSHEEEIISLFSPPSSIHIPLVDWSKPPIYDNYPEDLEVGKSYVHFLQEKLETTLFDFSSNFNDKFQPKLFEISKDGEHFGYYDFLGAEKLIPNFDDKMMLNQYFLVFLMKICSRYLAWRVQRKLKTQKYSKYLIRWIGRHQYLLEEDPLNSRTNSLQQEENDAAPQIRNKD